MFAVVLSYGRPARVLSIRGRVTRTAWSFLAAFAAVVSGNACGPSADLPPTRGYILISIDTLRADHLGAYGYERATSPFLDSLAARGVVFENAIAQLPGTLPSHMSIFTGLYPSEHDVFPPSGVLSPQIPTLPEVFRSHGFSTAGHTEGGYVHGAYGFSRGFDEFSHEAKKIETDVERTFERGLAFLRGLEDGERFFLFLHTYVVHDPYFPPEGYEASFWSDPVPEMFSLTGPNLVDVNRGKRQVSAEGARYIEAAYDSSIRYVDDVLRAFVGELQALGLEEDVTLILTSDHGEEFLEHGEFVHEQVYRETIHVPLIVVHPALEGRRVGGLVELVDLAPTLFEMARVKGPAVSGKSLVPLLTGNGALVESEAFSRGLGDGARTVLRHDAEGLHQLRARGPLEPGNHWGNRWVEQSEAFLACPGTELILRVQSYYRPRSLTVRVADQVVGSYELSPSESIEVRIQIPPGEDRKQVVLSMPGCDSPSVVAGTRDQRCLSFFVEGGWGGGEFYDLVSDPSAQHDLCSGGRKRTEMSKRLDAFQRAPVAPAGQEAMDPELAEHLRSLGYLQ